MVMDLEVIDYLRKHPYWYVRLCHYPESYDDLLEEMNQKKQEKLLEKLDRFSMIISMLEMLQ